MTLKRTSDYEIFSLRNHFSGVLVGLLVVLIVTLIILACVPPVSRDALTHHLAVPKLYLQHGGIYEIPSIRFSYYPMNLDLLYMIPLYFGNDIIPKFIHFAFALLTAGLIFLYLKPRLDAVYALLGALFFLSLPIVVKLSITVYVDLGLIFFSYASIFYLLKWIDNDFKLRYLLWAAVFCGLALGTKYNGLISFFLLTLFVSLIYSKVPTESEQPYPAYDKARHIKSRSMSKSRSLGAMGYGALFALIALLIFSPWMVKNFIWTHNPIYPLYNGWFNPSPVGNGPTLGHFAIRRVIFEESWWEIALIPLRIFFQGQDDQPKYFDGELNPFLFILPLFAFFHRKNDASIAGIGVEKKLLLGFVIFYVLYAFFKVDMRIRYIAPIIPPLVILAMFGLNQMHAAIARLRSAFLRRLLAAGIFAMIAAMIGINGIYVFKQFEYVNPFSFINGEVDRDAYIERYRPEYPVIQYGNRHLAKDARILGIFLGNRLYYSDREIIFGDGLFRSAVKKAQTADKLHADLKHQNITHLIIRFDVFRQWSDKQFDHQQKEILAIFMKQHVNALFSKGGYGLFEL